LAGLDYAKAVFGKIQKLDLCCMSRLAGYGHRQVVYGQGLKKTRKTMTIEGRNMHLGLSMSQKIVCNK